jgi:hypothetical protein
MVCALAELGQLGARGEDPLYTMGESAPIRFHVVSGHGLFRGLQMGFAGGQGAVLQALRPRPSATAC